jgi:hypothetical protein
MSLSQKEEAELYLLLQAEQGIISPFASEWDFLSRGVWTKDEASGQVRQFPAALLTDEGLERFAYLRYCTEERVKYRVRAYEKSRRMLVTWWLLALYLYDIMTRPNHANAVASDKLEKSAYLLGSERMQFIYDHIPGDVWPNKPVVTFSAKRGMGWTLAKCENTGSYNMAVASGESQMQQYTFSNVLMDEFPRWQWQEESWRNIQPTTQGGGCVDIVCTAELGSFAYDLLYDRVS